MKIPLRAHSLACISVACLHVIAVGADSILIGNPSFQANNPGGVGYGTPNAWTTVGGVGVNNGAQPFADNGFIPDSDQVGFIQGTGSLSQTLSGFNVGDLYWVQGFVNSRNCCGDLAIASVSLGGDVLLANQPVPPVGGANPYYFVNVPWIATAATGVLSISSFAQEVSNPGTLDASLLVDGISVIRRTPADIVIANPSFEATGISLGFPGYIAPPSTVAGWTRSSTANLLINGSNPSGNPFTDNGVIPDGGNVVGLQQAETIQQVLAGLSPGQLYRLELDYNARNGAQPQALFQIDGLTAFSGSVSQVGGSNPYHHLAFEFVASGTSTTVALANALGAPTDSTLLVDNIRVVAVPEPASGLLVLAGVAMLLRRRAPRA